MGSRPWLTVSVDPRVPRSRRTPERNVLGLAPAQRACLLVIDGLGWELLRDHPAVAPFLPSSPATPSRSPRVSRHDRHQPRLAGYRPPARPARAARLPGHDPRRGPLLTRCAGTRGSIPAGGSHCPPCSSLASRPASRPCTWLGARSADGPDSAAMRGADFLARQHDGCPGRAGSGRAFRAWPRVRRLPRRSRRDRAQFGVGSDAWYYQLAHVDKLAEQLARRCRPRPACT